MQSAAVLARPQAPRLAARPLAARPALLPLARPRHPLALVVTAAKKPLGSKVGAHNPAASDPPQQRFVRSLLLLIGCCINPAGR